MKSNPLLGRMALGLYLIIFFSYLLGPLIVMIMTAFNSSSFPSVTPWACFTFNWFDVLSRDQRILSSIQNSIIIGIGTVILSIAMGLAASLILTQIWPRFRSTFYTIIIAPILIPGVVLGISTLVFWDRMSRILGPGTNTLFHNGLFLTILGQSTFIASYTMLVFVARLQRYDPGLTEAALDLGATHTQAFRKILLPFMRPAIASAAVLAFLASFNNYNTTTFTFGQYPTLTIQLAQEVRFGINPSISALAFLIVSLTVIGALAYEAYRHHQQKEKPVAKPRRNILPRFFFGNWAALVLVLLAFGAIATVVTAESYNPAQCEARVLKAKKAQTARRIKAMLLKRKLKEEAAARKAKGTTPQVPAVTAPRKSPFGNVFNPGNLEKQSGTAKPSAPVVVKPKKASPFASVFKPSNLEKQSGTAKPGAPVVVKPKKASPFGNVFKPSNLEKQSGTAKPGAPAAAKPKKASPFGSVFAPSNLEKQSGTSGNP